MENQIKINEIINLLLKEQPYLTRYSSLAIKLDCSESFIRNMALGKQAPGWRFERDIRAFYDKIIKQ